LRGTARGRESAAEAGQSESGMDTFVVTQECIDLGLRAGAIVLRDVRVAACDPHLRAEIAREVEAIRSRPDSLAELRASPGMQALHEVLRRVGVRPRRQPPSVQRLFQYACKRGELPAINNLVDAYNLVSIRTRFSLGAHDLNRITVPVELRLFHGGESFTPLGTCERAAVTPGEFGYVDADDRVLCRLDVLQADFSKVTAEATNVLLIIEGTAAHSREAFEEVFEQTDAVVRRYSGGEAEVVAFPADLPAGRSAG